MKKKILLIMIMTATVLSVTACGNKKPKQDPVVQETDETAGEAETEKRSESEPELEKEKNEADLSTEENDSVTSWLSSYDWNSCPEKDVSSIMLYGKYKYPCDVYDFLEESGFEADNDAIYATDSPDGGDQVLITSKDLRKKDIYMTRHLSGRIGEDFIRLDSSRKDGRGMSVGDLYTDDKWTMILGAPTVVLGLEEENREVNEYYDSHSTIDAVGVEKLDKILGYLGRPDYLCGEAGVAYDLVWMLDNDHYISVSVSDRDKYYNYVKVYDFTYAGCIGYLKDENMHELIDFDEIIK